MIEYWLEHKGGAEFITVDGPSVVRGGVQRTDPFIATEKLSAVTEWIRSRTELPLWWAEWYPGSQGAPLGIDAQAAVKATGVIAMVESGVAVALGWEPQIDGDSTCIGGCLWSDTRRPGRGQPTAIATMFADYWTSLTKGGDVVRTLASSPGTAAVGNDRAIFAINQRPVPAGVGFAGDDHVLEPYEVRLLPRGKNLGPPRRCESDRRCPDAGPVEVSRGPLVLPSSNPGAAYQDPS